MALEREGGGEGGQLLSPLKLRGIGGTHTLGDFDKEKDFWDKRKSFGP